MTTTTTTVPATRRPPRWTPEHEPHRQRFLDAFRGVPSCDVIGFMNRITPAITWRHCSKAHIAESYAQAMVGERVGMDIHSGPALRKLDLESARRAALERGRGGAFSDWFDHYTATP